MKLSHLKSRIEFKKGQAVLFSVVLFLIISLTIVLGVTNPILRQAKISKDFISARQSYFLAEAGIEDTILRLNKGLAISTSETITTTDGNVVTTNTTIVDGKQIIATANIKNAVRKVQTNVALGTGISFHYGVQAGNGGFTLENSSSITGNVFAAGPVRGSDNDIFGDVISAGASGLVYGIHATGTVFSHTIGRVGDTTQIDKDAYYVNKVGSVTVAGTLHPNSADQPVAPLPISDEQIDEWEQDALAGGTISNCDNSGNYVVTGTMSLGPKKIDCNLVVKSSSGVLTVTGPLWVAGNITTQTGPTIKMSSALGGQNVAIIADDPSNPTGSGLISIGQSTIFQGSGSVGSFVFMISQNTSAENGGSTNAISMSQGASALVAYASHGLVNLSQSVSVKEVTAYKINLSQSANVTYDTGLPSALFESGPSGGYSILLWKETY